MNIDKEERLFELLSEIESICIGADSPDALENGERDPVDELKKCRVDLDMISNIVAEAKDIVAPEYY
jgi:hypothetical protein